MPARMRGSEWQQPKPASDKELEKHRLPVDLQVGAVIYRAGVPLLWLIRAMRDQLAHETNEERMRR